MDTRIATAEPRPWNAWAAHLGLVLLLLYLGYVYRGAMFITEGVMERDGFYHARYAQMLPERGLARTMPWMQFADWKDHFCDKDFLYHVYLAAFTRNAAEPLPGAKYGTLLLLLATLSAIYVVLKKWNAPFALLWVALAGVGSAHFLTRMFMIRSHCFSVLLMVLATHVILKRRFWPCFAIAFVYAWSYSVPLGMLITACAAEFGRWIVERDWKAAARMPLATGAGLLVGLTIHPYTPYSLKSVWMFLEIVRSGAAGSEVELGTEFQRLTLDSAFTVSIGTSLAALAVLFGGIALLKGVFKNRTLAPETAALVAVSTAWFVFMFVSFERFIEYSAPLTCLACGFVVRDMLGALPPLWKLEEGRRTAFLSVAGVAAIALVALHTWTLELNRRSIEIFSKPSLPLDPRERTERLALTWYRGRFFDGAARWMRDTLKPGTVIANFYWDDFPELFYSAPEMYYLVGLDPTFMRLEHREKALALEAMRVKEFPGGQKPLERKPIDFAALSTLFGTDYTILRRNRAVKYAELLDTNLKQLKPEAANGKIVYEDNEAVIYFYKK